MLVVFSEKVEIISLIASMASGYTYQATTNQ